MFQKLVISVEEDDLYNPLLVSSCIFPEDKRSETVCHSIISTLKEKVLLLYRWKEIHEADFGPDTAHDIPYSSQFGISKMGKGGAITTDTCNPDRLLISKLATHVTEVAK